MHKSKRGLKPSQDEANKHGITLPIAAPADRQLSPNDIGKILNVTGEAVKQWIYRGRLPATKHANGYWTVTVSDFEKFLAERNNPTAAKRVVLTNCAGSKRLQEAIVETGCQPVVAITRADFMLKQQDRRPALVILYIENEEDWKIASKVTGRTPILLVSPADLTDAETDRALELGAKGVIVTDDEAEFSALSIDTLVETMKALL